MASRQAIGMSFNSTIVRLKHIRASLLSLRRKSFNSTIVRLKPSNIKLLVITQPCFNSTIVRLKLDQIRKLSDEGSVELRDEQILRHGIFAFYVREWAYGQYSSWDEFILQGATKLASEGIEKPLAPSGTLLASNLMTVLDTIRDHFPEEPIITNVLLYLYDGSKSQQLPDRASGDFKLVPIDYSRTTVDKFICIEL